MVNQKGGLPPDMQKEREKKYGKSTFRTKKQIQSARKKRMKKRKEKEKTAREDAKYLKRALKKTRSVKDKVKKGGGKRKGQSRRRSKRRAKFSHEKVLDPKLAKQLQLKKLDNEITCEK